MKIRRHHQEGFTLFELLVVITLIAIFAGIFYPRISSYFGISLQSTGRKVAAVVNRAYNSAVLTGLVHRIVYDLDTQEYWVERGPPGFLLHTEESREREKERNRFKKDDEAQKPSEFKRADRVTRDKQKLGAGVRFDGVLTQEMEESQVKGQAYTHIFPNGFTEQTLVYISDIKKNKTSLIVSTLAGKTKVLKYHVQPDEVFK